MPKSHPQQKDLQVQAPTNSPKPPPATDPLAYAKTIGIAVTGDVQVTALEVAVIDSPHFQRLRGVRQLGTVNLVYPTALHTRFDHSLGTLAKADEMVLAVATNAKNRGDEGRVTLTQRKLARMYALLHDITHVPFGHTIEDEMGLYERHDKNPERISHFLGPTTDLGSILREQESEDFYQRLMAIYLWEDDPEVRKERARHPRLWGELAPRFDMDSDDAFVHDIVSNTVCADLLDYVARDNYFCNLGMPLQYRFLRYLYLKTREGHLREELSANKRRVFVRLWKDGQGRPRRDLLTDLSDLLDARYKVAERAYFHRTKIVTAAMLGRAIQEYHIGLATEDADEPYSDQPYLYENSDDSLMKLLSDWEDDVGKCEESEGCSLPLANHLQQRRLHRCTRSVYDDKAFDAAQESYFHHALKFEALRSLQSPAARRDCEDRYAAIVGKRPGSVLIYAPPENMNMKVADVNVRWRGRDERLKEIGDPVVQRRLKSVLASHRSLWAIRLIISRDLNEVEEQLLEEAFELDFLVPDDQERVRRDTFAYRLIEHRVSRLEPEARVTHSEHRKALLEGAGELRTVARCSDWAEHLDRATEIAQRELRKSDRD